MSVQRPTANGVSRFLALSGFERSTSERTRVRGFRNYSRGFVVTGSLGLDYVNVLYMDDHAGHEKRRAERLNAMAVKLAERFSVKLSGERIIVRAKEAP